MILVVGGGYLKYIYAREQMAYVTCCPVEKDRFPDPGDRDDGSPDNGTCLEINIKDVMCRVGENAYCFIIWFQDLVYNWTDVRSHE